MISAAERMKVLGRPAQDEGSPSSIFGSAAGLARSIESDDAFRVGFYPIICQQAPDIAMGIAACICYLLEQYDDIRVYRCFAKIEAGGAGDEVTTSDYQFTVEDWELEGLADNIQIAGRLDYIAGDFKLELSVDNSLIYEEEPAVYSSEFDTLLALLNALPAMAESIASDFEIVAEQNAIIAYSPTGEGESGLSDLLTQVFDWNLDVYLQFWGVDWAEAEILAQFNEISARSRQLGGEFPLWCLGMIAKQALQRGMDSVAEVVLSQVSQSFPSDLLAGPGVAAAASGLADLGHVGAAVDLLEPYLHASSPASVWISMVRIALAEGDLSAAIDYCQRGLEEGLDDPRLYWEYAQLLLTAEANEWLVDAFLFADPDEQEDERHVPLEITIALKHHLRKAPDNLNALKLLMAYMIDSEDEEVWTYFERLIHADVTGDFAGDVIERLVDLDDHDEAYATLRRASDANPYAHVFLAQFALANGETQLARETIEACRQQLAQLDDELDIELQRLELSARLPGFEANFAEIKLSLAGNRSVKESQVDLLEKAVEIAPKLADLYVTLSRCYAAWEDYESAAEVLADGENKAGSHPQFQLGQARILWTQRKLNEAIDKLNDGLAAFPFDVNLLVQMATFLIANEQLEDAREYILRAETIAPSHRSIWQVRRLVAQKLSQ